MWRLLWHPTLPDPTLPSNLDIEPATRKMEPATRKMEPATRKVEPAIRTLARKIGNLRFWAPSGPPFGPGLWGCILGSIMATLPMPGLGKAPVGGSIQVGPSSI